MSSSCRPTARRPWAGLAVVLLVACSPTFDWRDVRPPGTGATLLFPCKPVSETRSVALAGQPVRMTMLACEAGGGMFALAHAELGDATRAAAAVATLLKAQVDNLQAQAQLVAPRTVPGADGPAQRYRLVGRRPDGAAARQQLMYFARGARVYQVAVLGQGVAESVAESFFESVGLGP